MWGGGGARCGQWRARRGNKDVCSQRLVGRFARRSAPPPPPPPPGTIWTRRVPPSRTNRTRLVPRAAQRPHRPPQPLARQRAAPAPPPPHRRRWQLQRLQRPPACARERACRAPRATRPRRACAALGLRLQRERCVQYNRQATDARHWEEREGGAGEHHSVSGMPCISAGERGTCVSTCARAPRA